MMTLVCFTDIIFTHVALSVGHGAFVVQMLGLAADAGNAMASDHSGMSQVDHWRNWSSWR